MLPTLARSRHRRHHRTPRIRPAHSRASRTRLVGIGLMALVVAFWTLTAAADRSTDATVELRDRGPYRFASSAGPVEIVGGERAEVRYRASWLVRGPRLVDDRLLGAPPGVDVTLDCPGAFPCRAESVLSLPEGAAVEARSTGGPIQVTGFVGFLTATTGGDDLVLGPAGGTLRLTTASGDVVGHGLTARDVEVVTSTGEVHLHFRNRPVSVRVTAGDEPVTVELPPGEYAVTVEGSPSSVVTVTEQPSAVSHIEVDGRGPVRIEPAT